MKLIHLTDLHVTTEGNLLHGQWPNAVVARAIASVNAEHGDADLCIVTGDVTHNGTPEEYGLAADLLAQLSIPLHITLGNHDRRGAAFDGLPGVLRHEGGFAHSYVARPEGVFVLLDTLADGTHGGDFCEARAAWLEGVLARHPDRPIWLFMHHAPFALGMPAMDTIGMSDTGAERLARTLRGHGDVRHLFFGHYHRPVSGTWHGLPFSSHRSMMLQCGLDLRDRTDVKGIFEEPQYAVVLINGATTLVHYHDFDSGAALLSMGTPED